MTETGAIARVRRDDLPVLSMDVPLDLPQVQRAWPRFEAALDSLRGRRMMGLVLNREGIYRIATSKLERDHEHTYDLEETVVPGGDYLRLTLVGSEPEVYSRIGAAFDTLFDQADHDPDRPLIEFYRRQGEVDCLVPVRSEATPRAPSSWPVPARRAPRGERDTPDGGSTGRSSGRRGTS